MNFSYFAVFLTIAAQDLELLTDFYSQLFGQQPAIYRPSVYTEFRLEKLSLGLFQPKVTKHKEFQNLASSMSLCFEVSNLQQAIATLTKMGCPPPEAIIEASHGQEIYVYDPEGNRLILHQSVNNEP